jgi:hypothetical protein
MYASEGLVAVLGIFGLRQIGIIAWLKRSLLLGFASAKYVIGSVGEYEDQRVVSCWMKDVRFAS